MTKPILSFEIEHIFNRALFSNATVRTALAAVGITEDMRGNKVALLSNAATVEGIQNGPQSYKDALIEGRFGINRHEGAAHGGNQLGKLDFLRDQMALILSSGASADGQKYAILNLFKWTTELSQGLVLGADGKPLAVMGNAPHSSVLSQSFAGVRIDALAFDDPTNVQAQSLKASLDGLLSANAQLTISDQIARAESVTALTEKLVEKNLLTDQQKALVVEANGDTSAQRTTNAGVMALHDSMEKAGIPESREKALAERLASGLSGKMEANPSAESFDTLTKNIGGVLDALKKNSQGFFANLEAHAQGITPEALKSFNALLVGVGGGFVGDAVEYLNLSYDAIKKGAQTGDWTDFGIATAKFGVGAAMGALLITTSIVATTAVVGFVVGPAAAGVAVTFVVAGWAARGLYDAITNGAELIGKITKDLASVFSKLAETIEEAGEGIKLTGEILETILEAIDNNFAPPQFGDGTGIAKVYLVDPLDIDQPDAVSGGDADEQFYGRNNAVINGGAGNDEIYFKNGFGEARGGEGDDILLAGGSRFVARGEVLDLTLPAPPAGQPDTRERAIKDLRLTLDGGSGDDWVIAVGGTGAITIGGDGEDFVFNTSFKGQLYGDSIDGTGTRSTDMFWWSAGAFIMDAGAEDLLQLYGIPLTGGTNTIFGIEAVGGGNIAMDWVFPFVFYGYSESNQLIVYNALSGLANGSFVRGGQGALATSMIVENYDFGGFKEGTKFGVPAKGDLNMTFRIIGAGGEPIRLFESVFGNLISRANAIRDFAKSLSWSTADDPLVLDLDGDGIETSSLSQSGVHFDMDIDGFAQKTAWVDADDGLLVMDRDGDGRIEDVSELFGRPGGSGFAELRLIDGNGDGKLDIFDLNFERLQVWRDLNQDGISQDGELFSLAELGITSINAVGTALGVTTPSGTTLREQTTFTRADGTTGNIFEALFPNDPVDTVYNGDRGIAAWIAENSAGDVFNVKGYGRLADLDRTHSNDNVEPGMRRAA